jgi:hypothetical protein
VSIYAFSYPYRELPQGGNVLLRAFLTENISLEQEQYAPIKTDKGFVSYRLTAQVTDAKAQKVQIGDIAIYLDLPLPKDIPNGAFVSFDVMRLDVEFES